MRIFLYFLLSIKKIIDNFSIKKTKKKYKTDILFVNTFQKDGGAARAANRCFLGILKINKKSLFLSLFKESNENYYIGLKKNNLIGKLALKLIFLDRLQLLLYPGRKKIIFSPGFMANPLRIRISEFSIKLLHLHWVSSGIVDLFELTNLNVPIIWTLHDMWPFTGGCHYSDGCDKYLSECGNCPVLVSEKAKDISNSIWLKKSDIYNKCNITVVAPSNWMANLAKQSSLFSNKRIEIIPNGIDSEVYFPHDRADSRAHSGIKSSNPVILFGAHLVSDHRKGSDLLFAALRLINFPCVLLVFGEGEVKTGENPLIKVYKLGLINDDKQLARMYSSADVFVCPSRIDNLPNTIAEAMSCGVPCVAFDVGGIAEMITHKKNGWLAKAYDEKDFVNGIEWVINHEKHELLRAAAREKALAEYSMPVMAERYKNLYEDLIKNS